MISVVFIPVVNSCLFLVSVRFVDDVLFVSNALFCWFISQPGQRYYFTKMMNKLKYHVG